MSTSAVDNYQNALADNIAGVFLKNYCVWWTCALVLALNMPCIVVSLRVGNRILTSPPLHFPSPVFSRLSHSYLLQIIRCPGFGPTLPSMTLQENLH